jgi:hypothetical protein
MPTRRGLSIEALDELFKALSLQVVVEASGRNATRKDAE